MASTVKIFGREYKQWQVWAVVAGGAAVTYFVIRQHKASAAAASSAGDAVDPITGLTTSQDIAQYGSVAAADAAYQSGGGTGAASYGYGGISGGSSAGPLGSLDTPIGVTSGNGYATDADWDQAVTAGLANINYSASDVASAIGRYLGGLSLTPDQQNIVNTALGEFGPPPSGLKPIIAAPSTGPATSGDTGSGSAGSGSAGSGSGGSGSGGSSSGGSSSGGSTAAATATVSGGHMISHNNNDVVVGWTGHNAVKYKVTLTFYGSENGRTNTITGTTASYSGLPSGHTGHVTVVPYNAAGQPGVSGTIDISTT